MILLGTYLDTFLINNQSNYDDNNDYFTIVQIDFDRKYFWKWTDFRSYVEFIAAFTLTASLLTYIFLDNTYYVEILGFTSLLIEAMLGTPQFYDNYLYKSTYGMR